MKVLIPSIAAALAAAVSAAAGRQEIEAARGVIGRFAGKEVAASLSLSSLPAEGGRPVYEIADNGKTLRGSSGVALCKAFYKNATSKGAGICSWSGSRFDPAAAFAPSGDVRAAAPFRHYQYFNVCTFGYTMPYWDEARWMREIDWMALHGIDMPMALIANEAIAARVWKKLGLTDEEIGGYFSGPAHLPWMRMGNLSGRPDAPLPRAWLERSVRLQHAVLDRMRSLGMTPIVQGFAGFVPQAIKRVRPEARLSETHWCGRAFHNWFLSPRQPLFREMAKLYVQEWEKEFGRCSLYLSDSFNEMDLPWKTPEEKKRGLAVCGKNVYEGIRDGNPDATWVMMGWMFGYQRHIWKPDILQALLSEVPDDKMLLLDMAVDYSSLVWRNGKNWDYYPGFFGKRWVWSTIPNMGGKSAHTGKLAFYANAHLEALASPNRGKLEGYGSAPEGIENNEVVYELLFDAGWRDRPLDLDAWLANYNRCRYGASPEALAEYWSLMRRAEYNSLTPHPHFCWQHRPGGTRGSVRWNPDTFRALEKFASCADALKDSPLYALDLRENAALAAGAKLELLLRSEAKARECGLPGEAAALRARAESLFLTIDRLLTGHPTLDLREWIRKARAAGEGDEKLADYYETNARRIVTVWGPPVGDYSVRVWAGLVRSYYLGRYRTLWAAEKEGRRPDYNAFDRAWVEGRAPLGEAAPPPSPAQMPAIVKEILAVREAVFAEGAANPKNVKSVGAWTPRDVSGEWREKAWDVPEADVKAAKLLRFRYTNGAHRLDVESVRIEMDGRRVFEKRLDGFAGAPSRNNSCRIAVPPDATGNNSCKIIAKIRSTNGGDSYGSVELVK